MLSTLKVILKVCSPSTSASSTPVTVTVLAVFQLVVVKVSAPDTVPSPMSLLEGVTVTSFAGAVTSRTWKVAVVPSSPVLRPAAPLMSTAGAGGTVTLAVSVPGAVPLMPPRPVTVRVKVSAVFSVSAGIVTTGVALALLSNVTPLAGLVNAQP